VEDHAIARVFKEKGYKIAVADGRSLYSVRMYTDLLSLWQGWTKNLYSLIDSRIGNLLTIVAVINATVVFPWIQVAVTASMLIAGERGPIIQNMILLLVAQFILLGLWYRQTSEHHAGVTWANFFTLPLGGLTVTVLYFHAAYLVLSGSQVNWKGRRYTVNTFKTIQPMGGQSLDPALDRGSGNESADI
jgi:hypothetical protein